MEETENLRCHLANYFVNCLHLTGSIVLESPKLIDIFQGLVWKLCKDIAEANSEDKDTKDVKSLINSIIKGFIYDEWNYESPLEFSNIDVNETIEVKELLYSVNLFFGYLLKRNEDINNNFKQLTKAKDGAFLKYNASETFEYEKLTDNQM